MSFKGNQSTLYCLFISPISSYSSKEGITLVCRVDFERDRWSVALRIEGLKLESKVRYYAPGIRVIAVPL